MFWKREQRPVSLEEAIVIAETKLARLFPGEGYDVVVVCRDDVIERPDNWILPFETVGEQEALKRAHQSPPELPVIKGTGKNSFIPGYPPLVVFKKNGKCRFAGRRLRREIPNFDKST